uniref:Kinesin-like protein n=2 Tax=Octopus bimaculoides TaxID=37653 RepID=A0A0L8HL89_OCTBM|eukprot:XP_014771469.1 PREDICTED: kinesin-like calmodulin-binding protein homolog [Octopus bimaculoides]
MKKAKNEVNNPGLSTIPISQKITNDIKVDFSEIINEIQDIIIEVQKKLSMLINELLQVDDRGTQNSSPQTSDIQLNGDANMQFSHVQSDQKTTEMTNTETAGYSPGDDTLILTNPEASAKVLPKYEDKICQTELTYERCRCLAVSGYDDKVCQTELEFQNRFNDLSAHDTANACSSQTVNYQNCLSSATSPMTPSVEENLESPRTETSDEMPSPRILESNLNSVQSPLTCTNENACSGNGKLSPELFSRFLYQLENYHNLASLCTEQFLQTCDGIEQQSMNMVRKHHNPDTELISRYNQEMALRRKYHNELMKIKGNIRVFCRIRPLDTNIEGANEDCVYIGPNNKDVVLVKQRRKIFNFEMSLVFPQDCTQSQLFEEVESLITSCIDGFNVCIVAYGQTGSGKTYTMEGTLTDPGINPRALDKLFNEISAKHDWIYSVYVSMLEIYNEQIRDLLSTEQSRLEVWNIEGQNSIRQKANSLLEVNEMYSRGKRNRVTASTNMNSASSRSHTLLLVEVEGRNVLTNTRTRGKLYLIDLAGSENVVKSGVDGQQLKEAGFINKSLSTFCDVLNAIIIKRSHIPFRNSKLTHLLQDSLGGNSKTLLITQVSPSMLHLTETLRTLQFAQRLQSIQTGDTPVRSRERVNDTGANGMEDEMTELRTPNAQLSREPGQREPRCASLHTVNTPKGPNGKFNRRNIAKQYRR